MGLDIQAEQELGMLIEAISAAEDKEIAFIELDGYFEEAVFYIEKYLPNGDLRDRCIRLKGDVHTRKMTKPQFLVEVSQIFSQTLQPNTPIATEYP